MRAAEVAAADLRAAYAAVAIAEDRLERAIAAVEANHDAREEQLAIRERQLLIQRAAAAGTEWRMQS